MTIISQSSGRPDNYDELAGHFRRNLEEALARGDMVILMTGTPGKDGRVATSGHVLGPAGWAVFACEQLLAAKRAELPEPEDEE